MPLFPHQEIISLSFSQCRQTAYEIDQLSVFGQHIPTERRRSCASLACCRPPRQRPGILRSSRRSIAALKQLSASASHTKGLLRATAFLASNHLTQPAAIFQIAGDCLWRTSTHSHSIVAGGFPEMSYTTRDTPCSSLMMRLLTVPRKSYGRCAQCAVMKSMVSTARSAITHS